jgi:Mn2+/Fe2+ NRAMP family transporter
MPVTNGALVAVGAGIVLIPGVPLVPILFLTQALNAILLPPLLIFMARIARDPVVMGRQRSGTAAAVAYSVTIAVVVACVAALAVLTVA